MYYENYDDYMRNIGAMNMQTPYYNYTYPNQFNYMTSNQQTAGQLYPELYTEINRKIENKCVSQDCRLTEENVNRITEQIYDDYKDKSIDNKSSEKLQHNSIIKDLIKILVIKYLLSKQRSTSGFYPMMPPQFPNNTYYQY